MSGKDDPFGGRTVIIPNPGGAARRDPIEPLPPLSPQKGAIAASRSRCVWRAAARGLADAASADAAADAGRRATQAAAATRAAHSAGGGAQCLEHGGILGGEPDHPGGRAAADPAWTAAPAHRRHAGGSADELRRAGHHRIREEDRCGRRPPARGAGRQIRLVRNGRRHRPEPAGHRPRCLDAVQHAGAVLPGAHVRRRLLRGIEQGARQSGAALQSARTHACLPAARLRGPVSRRPWRRQRIAAHPARRLPDAAPRQGAHRRRDFAALARHDAAHAGSGDQGSAVGDRQRRRAGAGRRVLPAALPDRQ